jgi:aerobic carbon-monoxide dehydrogenase large subunit
MTPSTATTATTPAIASNPVAAARLTGTAVPRKEDPRLLTGRGRYLDDLGRDALIAAFVRSPHAHARVIDIDVTDAHEVEGLVAIYTYEDLAGRMAEPLPLLVPHPALTHGRTGYALAKEFVNHVGEPVVMVVASDRYVAEDVCERIQVIYESLPPVVGVAAAHRAEHLVHADVPGNVAAHLVQETGDARAAIAAAPHALELHLDVERSAAMPLEGRGVYARWDAADESLRMYSSTQTATGVRAAVAAKLDLPHIKVDVITPDVGGGFGVKIMHAWPEEFLVAWAARRLDRPIKWTEDRREHFVASAHERGQLQTVRVGFDDTGRILGLDVQILHDNGAYTPYGIVVPIITSTQLLGPYKPGAYRVEFSSLYTNTTIVTPYRGAGRPQSGSPGALLRRGPLRTVRAGFLAHGSSEPLGRAGLRCCAPALARVERPLAGRVHEAGAVTVRVAGSPGASVVHEVVVPDGLVGDLQPPVLPLLG